MKRALVILAVMAMTVACGGGDAGQGATTSPDETTTTTSSTTTTAPAPTTSSPGTTTADPSTTTTAADSSAAGGGYTYEEPGGYAAPSPDTSPPETGSSEAAATITIANFDFGASVTVAAGETVEVVNEDSVGHTFTSDDGVFDSDTLANGDTFSFTFEEPGEYAFHCEIHPSMEGTLTVEG